jgi:hypothetical protein
VYDILFLDKKLIHYRQLNLKDGVALLKNGDLLEAHRLMVVQNFTVVLEVLVHVLILEKFGKVLKTSIIIIENV